MVYHRISHTSKDNDKIKTGYVVLASASAISLIHAFIVLLAFTGALIIGVRLHFFKIVKNQYYGYPDEWIPSVSATIGDRFPGRNFFQFCMAAAAIPRMLQLGMNHVALSPSRSVTFVGFLRILAAGGWIYVPSGDFNLFHDVLMIIYLLLTVVYHVGLLIARRRYSVKISSKPLMACLLSLIPIVAAMVYLFIQHKVHAVAGGTAIESNS